MTDAWENLGKMGREMDEARAEMAARNAARTATPMMACGHAANASRTRKNGEVFPVCAICFGIVIGADVVMAADGMNLVGRVARCSCLKTAPSDTSLAFFEYLGPGSRDAVEHCAVCNYHVRAHEPGKTQAGHGFTPKAEGKPEDRFYCGCRGWD